MILMCDINAQLVSDNSDRESTMSCHGTDQINENGKLFTGFCSNQDLFIHFSHIRIQKITWVSPDNGTVNHIEKKALNHSGITPVVPISLMITTSLQPRFVLKLDLSNAVGMKFDVSK